MPVPPSLPNLTSYSQRSLEDVERERQEKGGLGLVKDSSGRYVDENMPIRPGGISRGEFYRMNPTQQKAYQNKYLEDDANWFGHKQLVQLVNAIGSPGFHEGLIFGGINAASKMGNALGDVILRSPVDTSDAWVINRETQRSLNPLRSHEGDTPADEGGHTIGRVAGGEILGYMTTAGGGTAVRQLGRIPQIGNMARRAQTAVQGSQAARRIATASATGERLTRYGPRVQTVVGAGNVLGQGLASTTAATVFMDPKLEGNTSNSLDGTVIDFGNTEGVPFIRRAEDGEQAIELPGRVDEDDNYLEAWRKTVLVDGVLAPFALLGAPSMVKPVRRFLFDQNVPKFLDEIANVELAPYNASVRNAASMDAVRQTADVVTPTPPAAAVPVDSLDAFAKTTPGDLPSPGRAESIDSYSFGQAADPWDSAIDRSVSAQRQNLQVAQQRQRLESMGLMVRSVDDQYELTFPGSVRPDVAAEIDQLRMQRGELLAQAEQGVDVTQQLGEVDLAIQDQMLAGKQGETKPPAPLQETIPGYVADDSPIGFSVEPDLRPELSTYLAELDELSDDQLRDMLPRVSSREKLAQRQKTLQATEQRVADLEQQLIEIQSRAALPEGSKKRLTATGAKRKTNKIQAELAVAKSEMGRLEAEPATPVLVGDQLDLELNGGQQQIEFPEAPREPNTFDRIEQMVAEGSDLLVDMEWDEQLGLYRKVGGQVEEVVDEAVESYPSGYASPEAYKDYLMGWPRDLLRKMNAPKEISGSGDIAAILKARTGRRVWSAKKEDIVDAMVEYGKRLGKWVEPPPPPARPVEFAQQPLELQQTMNLSDGLRVADSPSFGSSEIRGGLSGDGPAPTTTEIGGPDFAYQRMGMDAETRESIKQQILSAAVENGEVQADKVAIPNLPETEFNQTTLIDTLVGDMLADESGQLSLLYARGDVPTYKAGGKSAEAIIEEVRARYDWSVLDNAGQMAARNDWMDDWKQRRQYDVMTSQQQREAQIVDTDNFWNPPTVAPSYADPVRAGQIPSSSVPPYRGSVDPWDGMGGGETPSIPMSRTQAKAFAMPMPGGGDLSDVPTKLRKVFRWKPKGLVPEAVAEGVEKANAAASKTRSGRKSRAATKKQLAETDSRDVLNNARLNRSEQRRMRELEDMEKAALAKRERAAKLSQEGSC